MALVVSTPLQAFEPTDPTAALQAAQIEFESILSTDLKQQYQTQVQQFRQQKPNASDVIQFVAQIDATNHAKTRTSVSNRLCTFLEATRQFTGIVDTFISSNPVIGALVWGGLKTAVLVASNFASYFDEVTSMIMAIGKICPIYQEFSHLYADSTSVQQALCEYYAITIKLATKVIRVSQRTTLNSLLSSVIASFESEFRPLQDELAETSRLVQLQVSVAAKRAAHESFRLAELERKEHRQHRRLARKVVAEIRAEHDAVQQIRIKESARKAAKMRSYLHNQLSTINHQTPWKHAQKQRLANTADWFRDVQDFQAWEANTQSVALWCSGRMGSGKTILVSNVIAYFHLTQRSGDVVSFHFCRTEDEASISARGILGTLARQLMDTHISQAHGDELQSLYEECRNMDVDDIVDLLTHHLTRYKRHYIIIDGLDECGPDQIAILARNIARLCKSPDHVIKVFYSARPELEYQLFEGVKPKYRLSLSKTMVNADIEHYIDTELDECLEKQRLKLVNPETIWTIRSTLSTQNDGLLLFVRLFIEEICTLGNERAILKALRDPPKKISDLLTARLRRAQSHVLASEATKILQYCGCTKRPLTINELSELLSVSPIQTSLERTSIPQNMDQIIGACYGLIYVEEEETTVHYVHHCVKNHLFPESTLIGEQTRFVERETDALLGELCLTYLNFNDFGRQMKKFNAVNATPVAPVEMGLIPVRNYGTSNTINSFARKLLKARRPSQQMTTNELAGKMEDILGKAESSRLRAELLSQPYHFLGYAKLYWVWHTSALSENSESWRRFSACVRGENDLAQRPWVQNTDPLSTSEDGPSLSTGWALTHQHIAILLHEVLQAPCPLPAGGKVKILEYAIVARNVRLAQVLLDHGHERRYLAQRGFDHAARNGHETFLDMFISAGADIDSVAYDAGGLSGLQNAAKRGHIKVVECLLANMTNIEFSGSHEIAIRLAAGSGDLKKLEVLLAGRSEHSTASRGITKALQLAANHNHHQIADLLWEACRKRQVLKIEGETPLHVAARKGNLDVIERLLSAGYDTETESSPGWTALHSAARYGHVRVMERLLEADADMRGTVRGQAVLQVATRAGHLEIVEQLLKVGADTGFCVDTKRTALHAAAETGQSVVAKCLLVAGAVVDYTTVDGWTALHMAARWGDSQMVRILLEANADVEATVLTNGAQLQTALMIARNRGHLETCRLLELAEAGHYFGPL